ncbi:MULTISPECIES: CooT family nickel-binding protein [Dehalobacter]|uniref:CooT family nickel-binding protein n=1 Tax=Dehalobacter TaxID=56112 RepID=UPI0030155F0F
MKYKVPIKYCKRRLKEVNALVKICIFCCSKVTQKLGCSSTQCLCALFLESVGKIFPEEENLVLENIFGERKIVKAKIKGIELVDQRIVLKK